MKLNGPYIKHLRETKKELRQDEACKEIGISVVTLSNAENGDDVQLGTAKAIAAYYEKTVDEIAAPFVPAKPEVSNAS